MGWGNQNNGQGGGPWDPPSGGGNSNPRKPGQSPWEQNQTPGPTGGGSGGQEPEDLDAWLRKSQDHLRRMLPNGFGSHHLFFLGAALICLAWLMGGFYTVQQSQEGVVLRFGQWVRTEGPGLRYHLPWPIETVLLPEVMRSNRIEIGGVGQKPADDSDASPASDDSANSEAANTPDESMMLTGDENIVDISFTVLWQIKDPGKFLFGIRNPENTVQKAAESAMREVIGKMDIQAALTGARSQIEADVKTLLQTMMDEYDSGIQINQVQLQRVDPPPEVVDAFNDVQRARADRDRLGNEAEAYRNDILPKARGEAERLVQEAEGYKEQSIDIAKGEAGRFTAVEQSYIRAKDVTARRMYLETMEQILKSSAKIIMDGGDAKAGGALGGMPIFSLGDFFRQTQTPETPAAATGAAAAQSPPAIMSLPKAGVAP